MPRVSVLIPCHNAAPWVEAALASCLAQTWADREIVLVDDGSADDSLARVRRFEPLGVRVLAQSNRGASAARNAALRAATGDYFQFLDADDLLAPGKIAAQLKRAALEPTGTVFTGRWGRFSTDHSAASFQDANPLFVDLAPLDYLLTVASNDCMMQPAAWLVPRAVAEAAGPWDERLSLNDDGEYFARVVAVSTHVAHCPEAISYYRSNLPGSLSGQRHRRHLESGYLAATLMVKHLRTLADTTATRRAAADLLQRFAFDYYPGCPDIVAAAEAEARALGGSALRPLGGRGFQLLSRFLGWKLARRLQVHVGKFAVPTV